MTLEEIIHSVGYTQDGTKANFSFNEAKLIAQRYAQSQTQELQEQNAELVNFLQFLSRKGGLGLDVHAKIDNLLTKHNHLKSNTNETDKI